MNTSEPNNGSLRLRIEVMERSFEKLERRVEKHGELREVVAVMKEQFRAFGEQVNKRFDDMDEKFAAQDQRWNEDVKGLRRLLTGLGISIVVSAATFAITTLVVFGGPA